MFGCSFCINSNAEISWSLGFTFDDFSCVVDVALERVWVKRPGEEKTIKSKAWTKSGFSFGTQILYFGGLFIGSFQ